MRFSIVAVWVLIWFALSVERECYGQTPDYDTLSLITNQYVPNSFFKNRYKHYHLEQYLNNYQELIVYQIETVGDFSQPDPLTFSISGNSYRWNKYYYQGHRIDDVFNPGNALYKPNLYNQDLSIDLWESTVHFDPVTDSLSYISLQWNHGEGWGGPAPFTEDAIHLFHRTARESLYSPVENQRLTRNAFNLFSQFNVQHNGELLNQFVIANHGVRMWPGFNYERMDRYYPESFSMLQMGGELPLNVGGLFDSNYYLFGYTYRDKLNTEYYYDEEETAKLNNLNLSFYGKKVKGNNAYTSGLNLSTRNITHNNLQFSRNVIDQDQEGVEPWSPDMNVTQLSHAHNFNRKLNDNLNLTYNSYNSLINTSPQQNQFYNTLYYEKADTLYSSLYLYEWMNKQFYSGLLENALGVNGIKKVGKIEMRGGLDITADAMLVDGKSMVKPNWQFDAHMVYRPNRLWELTLMMGRKRIPFTYDYIRFASNNYMNGNVYYWNDSNLDKEYQEGEKMELFTTTGGKYHSFSDELQQPSYYYIEFPLKLDLPKGHSFVLYNQYRKYVGLWTVNYDQPIDEVGYTVDFDEEELFYQNNGPVNYIVEPLDNTLMTTVNGNDHFLFDTPFFSGSTFKYQKTGEKLMFSVSWTYHQLIGVGTIGNGPLHNDLAYISESMANPNSKINGVVLLDSDRSYIGRLILSYKFSERLSAVFTFKYKDGQVFAPYRARLEQSKNGENQVAVWAAEMKGNNEFNDDMGYREDAFFNSNLRIEYKGKLGNGNYLLNLNCYNIYDFGTDLSQYSFAPGVYYNRYSMELNIPRGVMFTAAYQF